MRRGRRTFPRRNRIVSGLALGVVVVEGALRSGSLITARNALDQGREVMAVPGNPMDARAGGCNALIRDGATLVRSAADVARGAGRVPAARARLPRPAVSPAPGRPAAPMRCAARLVGLLGPSPVAEDLLIRDLAAAGGRRRRGAPRPRDGGARPAASGRAGEPGGLAAPTRGRTVSQRRVGATEADRD